MTIEKLKEFAKNTDSSGSNTEGLDIESGFPSRLQPARQWFNWLFNKVTSKINEIIDNQGDLDDKKVGYVDIVDNLSSSDSGKPLSANMGKKLNDEKVSKSDLYSGEAPIFAARAWVNFNGSTGEIRKSGNVDSVVRNSHGNYTITFTEPMQHADYVIITGISYFSAGTNFGVVSQTANGFTLQAVYGGDNTIGDFDPLLAMVTIFC